MSDQQNRRITRALSLLPRYFLRSNAGKTLNKYGHFREFPSIPNSISAATKRQKKCTKSLIIQTNTKDSSEYNSSSAKETRPDILNKPRTFWSGNILNFEFYKEKSELMMTGANSLTSVRIFKCDTCNFGSKAVIRDLRIYDSNFTKVYLSGVAQTIEVYNCKMFGFQLEEPIGGIRLENCDYGDIYVPNSTKIITSNVKAMKVHISNEIYHHSDYKVTGYDGCFQTSALE